MTFTFSKKDILYCALVFGLIIALVLSVLVNQVGAQANSSDNTSTEQSESDSDSNGLEGVPTGDANIPHLNCSDQVYFSGLSSSDIYNPNADYSHTFMSGGPLTQDINGDNLPDYIYSSTQSSVSGDILSATTVGCTYLNNGSGWDRVYICYASTRSNHANGNIIEAEYRGDCAGTPSN